MEPLTLLGTLDSLQPIGKYVVAAAAAGNLDQRRAYDLRLAVDEIATNIVTHGYAEAGLEGAVTIRADLDEQALTITLEDTGVDYDPTRRPPPKEEDFTRALEDREIGGWGVYLAIQGVDKFLYRRIGNRNRNVFVMNLAPHGTLLIVDDCRESRDVLSRYLKGEGYTVLVADDGEQGLKLLRSQKVDLALLDVDAPGLDALELLLRMKADIGLRGTPVIVLSGSDSTGKVERCLEQGADDYLSEPYSPVVLRARVGANLEKQRVRLAEAALKESQKYERDVQIGRQIQRSFLPDILPQPAGWEIAARFEPARQVAGDFYDAFPLTHNRVGFVIADVCDKGVAAALFMALFRSLIRVLAQQHYTLNLLDALDSDRPPGTRAAGGERGRRLPSIGTTALKNAVSMTNNYIIRTHADTSMFATLFFGVLDPATGSVIYVNGGHEPPIVFDGSGVKARLEPTGPAVGVIEDFDFQIEQAQLAPGDMLLLYTDGVPEAKDPDGRLFTEKRLLGLLDKPFLSAVDLLGEIEARVREHIAGAAQYDDITMLAVRRARAVEA